MLHGYTQSGPLFHSKTRALEKHIHKAFHTATRFPDGVELVYPTAPIKLLPTQMPGQEQIDPGSHADLDAWGWWFNKGDAEPYTCAGIERTFDALAAILKTQGPFTGVIGFSQGAALASMLASLLEPGRRAEIQKQSAKGGIDYPVSFVDNGDYDGDYDEGTRLIHPPLKFAACYCGFAFPDNKSYKAFWKPKLVTPILHVLGTLDTVVQESHSLTLIESCDNGPGHDGSENVVYHPGGHFLPNGKQYLAALTGFIDRVCHERQDGPAIESRDRLEDKVEDKVEDMDVPF